MFSLKLVLRIKCSASQNILRSVRSKNAGIHHREKLLSLPHSEIEDFEFEELESDFMDVDKSHKEHKKELEMMKEKEKYLIVKQKYFKEKYPNFLTWHDKEQIKYLHSSNPEEWTIDQLSESFPALPEVITKILKSNWRKSEDKIKNHDASVQRNWDNFKRGKFSEIPLELVEHLNKFTDRSLNFNSFTTATNKKELIEAKPVRSDFSEIIKSYGKLKGKNNPSAEEIEVKNQREAEEPSKSDYKSRKHIITLAQLQSNLVNRATSGGSIDEDDKLIMNQKSFKSPERNPKLEIVELTQCKYSNDTGAVSTYYERTDRDLAHLNYPEKIIIPKELRKREATYKLSDCFYNYDGKFLYRVPGMG